MESWIGEVVSYDEYLLNDVVVYVFFFFFKQKTAYEILA